MYDLRFLLFAILATTTPWIVVADTDIEERVCIGTNGRMSVPSNREHHYRNLKDRFTNCTYVDGNLELTWLQDPTLDLSFLQYIREVTGYVLISHVDVPRIVLPRLQIIRGRTLFKLNVRTEEFALLVTLSKMMTLELPSLRDILNGGVAVMNNYNLCHVNSINWEEIMTAQPKAPYIYVYNFTQPERECPRCHPNCTGEHCWGEGEQNCQQFSKTICSPQCWQGRCFGPEPRECCHLFCAGGCTGPKQSDCLACRNFYDDGVCTQECPPMKRYNPTTYSWETNPAGKYAYGATCVRNCPDHLLKDSGACVRSCPEKKKAVDGECVPCDGPCPKTCSAAEIVHAGNIDSFKDCTVVEGNLEILDHSFKGYQQVYANFSFGPRHPEMHPDRLEVFSTLKEVTGFMNIQGSHEAFTNLSYFRNLETIGGRQLKENFFASLYIVKTSLKSLELKSLKRINSGAVVILENKNLCFAKNIDWRNITKSSEHHSLLENNRPRRDCQADGQVCHGECSQKGCWGAGADQCLECSAYKFEDTCVGNCSDIIGVYNAGDNRCAPCHEHCSGGCTGPGAQNCISCKAVRDGPYCSPICPTGKYNDSGVCVLCHPTCVDGCTGPADTIGQGGCTSCQKAIINGDVNVERCIHESDECPKGYYVEWVGPQEQGPMKALAGKAICRKCHPRCNNCTGYGFHVKVCKECAGYRRGEQCEDECPTDHYADDVEKECIACHSECRGCHAEGPSGCLQCRNYKVYEEGAGPGNTTAFNCTATCPPEYPHKIFPQDHVEPYCSVKPIEMGSRIDIEQTNAVTIGVLIAFGFLLVLCGLFLWYCRQKTRAKEEAVKMTMVLTGCEDSEPLRPSNVRPNLAKLRIVKEAEMRRGAMLGCGAFGRVYKGVWVPEGENVKIPVAIKVLREETSSNTSKEFLEEAYIMATVEHPNLLQLLAVCLTSQMMLVTQLMPLGCLLDYVRSHREKIGSKALLNWSTQIARGMSYLEERRLVHRDLAARNVLVQNPNCVKITDFGLAKLLDVNEDEYKAAGGKMPIKWLALECIQHRIFTHKSDVWAFGVTIWELLTYGARPYENVSAKDVPELIENGLKLPQPAICTLDVYCILLSCWMLEAEARPTFKQLTESFAEKARDPGRYLYIPGDKFMRLPSYTQQDEKELIKSLSTVLEGPEPVMEADEYLQPKTRTVSVLPPSAGPQTAANGTDIGPGGPESLIGSLRQRRYCSDPLKGESTDEVDTNKRGEARVGGLKLDLPVDEDDYLMPSTQASAYMDLIGDSKNLEHRPYPDFLPAIDNPEYLLNSVCSGPAPTQTLGIPLTPPFAQSPLPSNGHSAVADKTDINAQTVASSRTAPKAGAKEEEISDHEYYNDVQRELQPLRRSETTV